MDKENFLKEVEARLSERAKAFSCVLMLTDTNLDKEPLLKNILQIEGSELKFIKKTNKFRFTLKAKTEGYGCSINDHIRSLASSCANQTGSIRNIVENGTYGSITYFGVYENSDVIAESIDPDISEFLSSCKLPLYIHYGHKP